MVCYNVPHRKWVQAECVATYIHSSSVRKRGGVMVESSLILTTYLLFFGLVFITIINIALIIALAILLSKQ